VRETLRDLPGPVDFLLNDGWPEAALDVLKLVTPALRPGAMQPLNSHRQGHPVLPP
jgi:predicted O-methyltransferase YrrM